MIRALQIPNTSSGHLDRAELAEEFCNRWKKDVFAFCRMFLGVDTAAEHTALEVLLRFCQERRLRLSDSETATRLLAMAFRLMQPSREERHADRVRPSRLDAALQQLPALERAAVIAKNLMHLEWTALSQVLDVSAEQAHEVWVRAMLRFNDELQTRIKKEHAE